MMGMCIGMCSECPTSSPVRQNQRLEEQRISGSS
jgi:hypothetical protein